MSSLFYIDIIPNKTEADFLKMPPHFSVPRRGINAKRCMESFGLDKNKALVSTSALFFGYFELNGTN